MDRKVFDEFMQRFTPECELAARQGRAPASDGATPDEELARVEGLLRSATAEGAVVQRVGAGAVIRDVPMGGSLWNGEIFGPIVAVTAVDDARQAALELGEASSPLGVSIWSRNSAGAETLAKMIWGSMVWINDSSFGLPHLPWGGWGKAGRGTLFSSDSLTEVTRLKWISRHPALWARPRFWWHPYTPFKEWVMEKAIRYFR